MINMKKQFAILFSIAALLSLVSFGCANVTVDAPDICTSQDLGVVPAAEVSTPFEPVMFEHNFDLSEAVSKVGDVADDMTATVTVLKVSGTTSLRWIDHITVEAHDNSSVPSPKMFASYQNDGTGDDFTVTLKILMNSSDLVQYLRRPLVLSFEIFATTGPSSFNRLSVDICADVQGTFNKSL